MLSEKSGASRLVAEPGFDEKLFTVESMSVSSPEGYSSSVWLVLFFLVISFSLVCNTVYVVSVIRRNNVTITHLIIFFMFIINLLDYGLLICEFTLDTKYRYSEVGCTVYQCLVQVSPLLSSATIILLLVFQTYFSSITNVSSFLFTSRLFLFPLLLIIVTVIIIPFTLYSNLSVNIKRTNNCFQDISKLNYLSGGVLTITDIFFMFYKSVLIYWLPLALAIHPIHKMVTMVHTYPCKQVTTNLTIAVTVSFIVFHFPLATVELTRQIISTLSINANSSTTWILQVLHSLFLIISFFFHIFRPLVCLVLNQDNLPSKCIGRILKCAQEHD